MKKKIAVLPGDGIGPEVITEAIKALNGISSRFRHTFVVVEGTIGGASLDRYGTPLSQETLDLVKHADAVLLGAVGGPKWDDLSYEKRPEQGLLKLREELKVFANLRPIKVIPSLVDRTVFKKEHIKDVDIIFVRELTSGIYFGQPRGRKENGKVAIDTCVYSKNEIARVAKIAFDLATRRRQRVTSVDKANVLETSRLWRETVAKISKDYPKVTLEHLYVDNAAMQIIKNPKKFDVILTSNMFGDILSDEAAVLAASVGMLPSVSMGRKHPYLYEPIHGSSPKHAGKNKANPIGSILSAALMLRYSFHMEKEARAIEKTVEQVINEGIRTYDIAETDKDKSTTSQMGDIISENIKG